MTDQGSHEITNVKNPGGALIQAVGDGETDDTSAIQAILDQAASSTHNKVFFPPGEYLISRDIVIQNSVELHGTEIGIAVIKASTPNARKLYNALPVQSVILKNLYLDGIRVNFDGGNNAKPTKNITVLNCVFFSTVSPSANNSNDGQLTFRRLRDGTVDKCIFLRGPDAFGVASKFFRTKRVQIRNNVFGLDLSKVDWLSTELEPEQHWTEQKQKLQFLQTSYDLADDQGFFKCCLYDAYDEEMRISQNVFNGSPNTGSLHKDHAMYLKGFDGVEVAANFVRGWPADPSGGIKARNGKNLIIVRNYIDDTGILLYTHDPHDTSLHHGLENVVTYGNHIVQRSNPGHRASGISYYERHFTGVDKNLTYSANQFEIVDVSDPTSYTCIWLTNGDLSNHHVYKDNVYYGTTTTVKLQARHETPSFETGNIDVSIPSRYSYPVYELNIPTY